MSTANTLNNMLFGSLAPKVQRNSIGTVSQGEIENLLSAILRDYQALPYQMLKSRHQDPPSCPPNDPLHIKNSLNVHFLVGSQHRKTPQQAKIYIENYFIANAPMTELSKIDCQIDIGYEILYDTEFHYTQTGCLYKYLMSPQEIMNDQGIDRYQDNRAEKVNRTTSPSFLLQKFYKGYKSFEI